MDYQQQLDSLNEDEQREYDDFALDSFKAYVSSGALFREMPYDVAAIDWQAHHERCVAKLAEIIARRPTAEGVRWMPERHCEYWVIEEEGAACQYANYNQPTTDEHCNAENCFRTREEAEAESRRTTARRYYERRVRECNGGELWPEGEYPQVWVMSRDGRTWWMMKGYAIETGRPGVATDEQAEMIRAEMEERGMIDDYFGRVA